MSRRKRTYYPPRRFEKGRGGTVAETARMNGVSIATVFRWAEEEAREYRRPEFLRLTDDTNAR